MIKMYHNVSGSLVMLALAAAMHCGRGPCGPPEAALGRVWPTQSCSEMAFTRVPHGSHGFHLNESIWKILEADS
jgi:hypothetical protein